MGWNRGNARNRLRRIAALVFVFQTIAAGLGPIAHARSEALKGERKVEADHSTQCVPVHSDTTCTLTTMSAHEHSPSRVLEHPPATRRIARPGTLTCTLRTPLDSACNPKRAPPSP